MVLSRQDIVEARKVYETYWESYLTGNIKAFAASIDDHFSIIGTSEGEISFGKDATAKMYQAQFDEVVGKAEQRNRQVREIPTGDMLQIIEFSDIYVLIDSEWSFYSKFRLSTLLHQTPDGWKLLQQHGSLPDMRVGEGETVAIDKISKENLELRDAVKRRTTELENKNHELEIEAALERVRAVAMGMNKPEDMLSVCREITAQLQLFGVDRIRNVQTAIIDPEIGQYLCYQYFAPYNRDVVEATEYLKSPVEHEMVKQMLASQDAYFTNSLSGSELDAFSAHRKAENYLPDPLLDEAKEVAYCFLSIGEGGLGLTLYKALDEDVLNLFRRFHQVFSLAYRRFRDIQKAEAQAKEARIETALEKVRSRSLGMQKSDELQEVIQIVYTQFADLGIHVDHTGFIIDYSTNDDMHIWLSDRNGVPSEIRIPYFDSPHWNSFLQAKKMGDDFFANHHEFEEKNKFYKTLFELIPGLSDEIKSYYLECPGLDISTVLMDNVGLYIERFSGAPYTDDENQTLKRFGKVFQQAYTRFLDLQKAEAQAREAKIETALEKVRSRTMGMQHSDELANVANVLFAEMNGLVHNLWTCGFVLCERDRDEVEWWLSLEDGFSRGFFLPNVNDYAHATLYDGWLEGDAFRTVQLEGDKLQEHYDWLMEVPVAKNIFDEMEAAGMQRPEWQKLHAAYFSKGYLVIITREPCPEEEIFKRFASVFDQTYTRFLDLKKAEAQSKENQIQLALERVRARTMAMQKSDELAEAASLLFHQVNALGTGIYSSGFTIWNNEDQNLISWMCNADGSMNPPFTMPFAENDWHMRQYESWENGESFIVKDMTGSVLQSYFQYLRSFPLLDKAFKISIAAGHPMPERQVHNIANFSHGNLLFITHEPLPETHDIFIRFAKVFDQTYTRFLDLQKAESQAREAQIETALEKVRSRSLAMQSPDELIEVAKLLREEMGALGVEELETSSIYINNENSGITQCWFTIKDSSSGKAVTDQMTMDLQETWVGRMMLDFYQSPSNQTSVLMQGAHRIEWIRYCESKTNLFGTSNFYGDSIPDRTYHLYKFSNGFIGAASPDDISVESWDLLKRATGVFSFAYTRFRDLQRAENSAREARIELALERIRAQVSSMQESSDLLDIVVTMRTEFVKLGHEAHYFWHMRWLPETYAKAMTSGDGTKIGMVMTLPRSIHGEIQAVAEWEKGREPIHVLAMDAETAVDYVHKMVTMGDFERVDPQAPTLDDIRHIGGLTFVMARTTHGEIGFSLPGVVPDPPKDSVDTLVRFAGVFDLAYKRFEDLKYAERQHREAQIELALERVRARSLAMHKSDELADLSLELVKQVHALGVETWFCAFNIYDEDPNSSLEWGSNGQGTFPEYRTPREGIFLRYYEAGQKGETFLVNEIDEQECPAHYEYLCTLPGVGEQLLSMKDAGIPFPVSQIDHVAFFEYGYLLFITFKPAPEAHPVFKRFAKVFEQTYTRFLDLKKAEIQTQIAEENLIAIKAARKKAEEAFTELKATQSQLVQQEKLASLGQLTAGIAHEIKNPLNFVNNFSEVSLELIDEALEELSSSPERESLSDIRDILADVQSNLTKIHQHGTRANGIVSSMLQHSRGGSGKMEHTDLNALVKEYVNLAFHGMRAGKNPINVKLDFNLDDNLGHVNLIGEDFSRVVLNLANNAFDAMREKSKTDPDYKPVISIATMRNDKTVEFSIADDGPGIPDEIRDKILQPFFTTKKGTEGTGLGLSITNDIIKAHGGQLEIETSINKGSRFIIKLIE